MSDFDVLRQRMNRIGPITSDPNEQVAWNVTEAAQRRRWQLENERAKERLAEEREAERRRGIAAARRDAKRRRTAEDEAIAAELRMQGATEEEVARLIPRVREERILAAAADRQRPPGYEPLL